MKKKPTNIIAEIGVNHNGSISRAKKMIDILSSLKVNYAKFQLYNSENLVIKKTKQANYQRKNSLEKSQYAMLKKYEINEKFLNEVISYCKLRKIDFLASVFDLESLNLLLKKKIKCLKIASGEINNYPLLEKISQCKLKVFLSTGMSNIKEIKQTIEVLNKYKKNKITLMHCTTSYPTKLEEVNLNVMNEFKKIFKLDIGYSDHTIGNEVSCAAVALGANVIEKHFTLNKRLRGPDHSASAEPKEFKDLIDKIRKTEIFLGSSKKKITKSERNNFKYARKSIYAKKDIKKNDLFTAENLITMRPALGLSPMKWNQIINKKAKKNYKKNELIK